jgi:hypothetical protein
MRRAVSILGFLFSLNAAIAQISTCHLSVGFQGQDFINSIVPLSNSTYLATALNDTLKQTITGAGVFQQMLVYKLNNQCDTLWKKALTPIGLGGIGNLKKINENRFLASGGIANPSFFPLVGSSKSSPFVMLMDSNAVPIATYTHSLVIGVVTRTLLLPNGDILASGYELFSPSSIDFRVFLALYDSSLNPKWYRQVMPQSLTYQSGIKNLLITNEGCGLLLFTEQLTSLNQFRPRIVKFDLLTGDTIQTRLYQPTGIANTFEFSSINSYKDEFVISGFYANQNFTTISNFHGVYIKLNSALVEKSRQLIQNRSFYDLLIMDDGKMASFAYFEQGTSLINRLYVLDSNFSMIDSSFQFQPSNKAISLYSIDAANTGQWTCAGAVASSATTFGQSDMYFSVVNHSYGAPYVHDYCGLNWPDSIRKKPTSAFTAAVTADSIFFSNTSVSGLQCQPDLKSTEWFIDNYQLLSDDQDLRVPKAPTLDTLRVRLVVSNYFGCKDTLNAKVVNTTGQVLGTDALAVSDQIYLYPNPANEVLQVQMPVSSSQQVPYEVRSITGQPMLKGYLHGDAVGEIRLNSLPSGLYILQLQVSGRPQRFKFVKE